ncbi:T9SS type A sorting domain-containing protein [uncultured Hymenobacter sp.]|uniref:T9SS type A sorting domain-containing protein n=1 Tax=uncultured Hymenobacter sp. TaxID=170016 RepID=UPI0035CA59B0
MSAFFRTGRLLFLPLLLAPTLAQAQLVSGALPADPARAGLRPAPVAGAARRGTATISLPFFDDFTTPREGRPSPLRWLATGGAYVSNRLAVAPPSRGAATLDGLKANGLGYTPGSNAFGALDTLTSQPIDLSALSPASSVRLSYAWQAGTVGDGARRSGGSTPVLLETDFWDGTRWTTVRTETSTGTVNSFRQVILPVDQAAYFRPDFQFRFRATGNGADGRDAWSVDYVLLDQNRPANDTTFRDIAISRGLSSPLRRYAAMPVWQFNAAPTPLDELNPELSLTINSLALPNTTPTPITWQGTVREVGGAELGSWTDPARNSRSITAGVRQDVITGNARLAPVPITPTQKTLRYELTLLTNELNPRLNSQPNDSISRDVDLRNYYAYDDGTAEGILALPAVSTGPASYLAYRIDLNQRDQVRGLRLYPVFVDAAPRSVSVAIWDNVDNEPDSVTAPRALATRTLTPELTRDQAYVDIFFERPVEVTGSFWIGYGQPSQGRFLHYGEDLNSAVPANYLFQNTQGDWQAAIGNRGAPMLRPLMTNFVLTASTPAVDKIALRLYPNPSPARGPVRVAGASFRRAALLNALGQTVWQQPAAEAGRPLLSLPPTLAPGLYLVRFTLADGGTAVRRLVVE